MGLQECGLNLNHARRELQPHGTAEFPCAGYAATVRGGDVIPWHWHEELEVIYAKEGSLQIQVPSKRYQLRAGALAVVNVNVPHFITGAPEGALRSLVFSPLLLTGGGASAFAQNYITPLLTCAAFTCALPRERVSAERFLSAFDALAADAFGYEFTVREALSRLALGLCRQFERELMRPRRTPDDDTLRLEQMMEYIHAHYAGPVTLADIAGAAGVSERECLRCFQRTIGVSPIQYLLQYRLMQGASLLRADPGASVAEIAGQCGFDYPGYFSKQFRRFYRCSPREYQRGKTP